MTSAPLPDIDETANRLAEEIVDGEPSVMQIKGDVSVGKSTLLRRIRSKLSDAGKHPILVSPPSGALDVASITLTQLASQLYNGHPTSSEVSELIRSQEVQASKKHKILADWLVEGKDKFVLLCDDPTNWEAKIEDYPGSSESLAALYRTLLDTEGLRRVVTGYLPDGRSAANIHWLKANSDPEEWLQSRPSWGDYLADHAQKLWEELSDELRERTPLVIRLMVGLVALGEAPSSLAKMYRKSLAEKLWDRCEEDPQLAPLCDAWSSLALVREGFRPNLLQVLDAPDESLDAGQLLRHCLLFKEDGHFMLHEMLRYDAKRSATAAKRKLAHAKIASDYYRPLFENAADGDVLSQALTYEMEAYYHAAASGKVPADLKPFFAEQLNLLGRYLSEQEEQYSQAAEVFSRAIGWEPEDDYAHHYRAYNLDRLGKQPQDVDLHYRKAIELRNDHPWWWSRWICFLLTRGRVENAEAAWSDAVDALAPESDFPNRQVFSELHAHVLVLALHFGQLNFAERVLRDIPKAVVSQDGQLLACQKRLHAFRLAEEHRAVVPLPYLKEGWWNEGPFRLYPELRTGHKLVRWFAARVKAVGEEMVDVHIAEIPVENSTEPSVLFSSLPVEQLHGWAVMPLKPQEGDYWEIGVYDRGGNEQHKLVINNESNFPEVDEQLFRIIPDPNRYSFGGNAQ